MHWSWNFVFYVCMSFPSRFMRHCMHEFIFQGWQFDQHTILVILSFWFPVSFCWSQAMYCLNSPSGSLSIISMSLQAFTVVQARFVWSTLWLQQTCPMVAPTISSRTRRPSCTKGSHLIHWRPVYGPMRAGFHPWAIHIGTTTHVCSLGVPVGFGLPRFGSTAIASTVDVHGTRASCKLVESNWFQRRPWRRAPLMVSWKIHEWQQRWWRLEKCLLLPFLFQRPLGHQCIWLLQRPLGHPCIVLQQFSLGFKSLWALHNMKADHIVDIVHQKPMGYLAKASRLYVYIYIYIYIYMYIYIYCILFIFRIWLSNK